MLLRIRAPLFLLFFMLSLWMAGISTAYASHDSETIRVGILHSLTGTMASSEMPVRDATLLAIESLNQSGGLLGQQIVPVIADGQSDEQVFAKQAARLIRDEHVDVIFGGWTSASRKAVKPVVEAERSLLFYPVQYEGLETSDHIIYTGAAPNQQIIPAISWALNNLGKRIYLVGSDYVFPRIANWLIRTQVALLGGRVVGESYLPLGSQDADKPIAAITKSGVDVIINTINGDSNQAFFHALRQSTMPSRIPVLSFSLAEPEINRMPLADVEGHYAAWNYFQSLDNERNRHFVRLFHQRFGDKPVSDPMEAAWIGVHLWAKAVESAGTSDPKVIHHTVLHQSMNAPEGIVSIDQKSRHLWKTAYIGRINAKKQFDIVWHSKQPIKPFPYPLFIKPQQARDKLEQLWKSWGGHWSPAAQAEQ